MTFAVILAVGGMGVLIFFIHHLASSIQASSIVASAAEETMRAVKRLFPDPLGNEPEDDDAGNEQQRLTENWQSVPVKSHGYIQRVDTRTERRRSRVRNRRRRFRA